MKDEIEKIGSVEETKKTGKKEILEIEPQDNKFESIVSKEKVEAPNFEKVEGKWVAKTEQGSIDAKKSESIPERITATESSTMAEHIGELKSEMKEVATLSSHEVQDRAKDLAGKLENLKQQLEASKADLKPSYHKVLENRLSHIDDNLKVAIEKAGGEYTTTEQNPGEAKNPIKHFLHLLSDSQRNMNNLDTTIEQLHISGKNLNPTNMLALQVKVAQIQQQVELFASLLSKALESAKTIMNVQV